MPRLVHRLGLLGALALAAASVLVPSPANACGGGSFYAVDGGSEKAVTTGHRVVISLSKTQTILWDQIDFTGAPEDFAWVYPIQPGARLELANDAWLDALEAGTTTVLRSPEGACFQGGSDSGGGCCYVGEGSAGGGDRAVGGGEPPPVTVLDQHTIGPYKTVVISSKTPGAIGEWLSNHGYNIPADVKPILDDYVAEGYDFIALRLAPGQGTSRMQPVRVVTPGPLTTFPMRMLAAGAGDHVRLNVFVLTEGRVSVDGFAEAAIDPGKLAWSWATGASNYDEVRDAALAENGGATFLTTFASQARLFTSWEQAPPGAGNITGLYYGLAKEDGVAPTCDASKVGEYVKAGSEASGYSVVDLCDESGNCAPAGEGEIDSRVFACGAADDLAVALIGMHPRDVWLTRFEANLPRQALSKDLVLTATPGAKEISGDIQIADSTGDPCDAPPSDEVSDDEEAAVRLWTPPPRPRSPLPPSAVAVLAAGLGLAFAAARRLTSRRPRRHAQA